MTMEEIEYRTPNGLHDAYLEGLSADYEKQTLTLRLNWLVGQPDDITIDKQNARKTGDLVINGLRYCVIEAPEKGNGEKPDQINGFSTGAAEIERCMLPDVDDGVFRHSIYVGYWNSFIHFAGTSAEVIPSDLIVREMGA